MLLFDFYYAIFLSWIIESVFFSKQFYYPAFVICCLLQEQSTPKVDWLVAHSVL